MSSCLPLPVGLPPQRVTDRIRAGCWHVWSNGLSPFRYSKDSHAGLCQGSGQEARVPGMRTMQVASISSYTRGYRLLGSLPLPLPLPLHIRPEDTFETICLTAPSAGLSYLLASLIWLHFRVEKPSSGDCSFSLSKNWSHACIPSSEMCANQHWQRALYVCSFHILIDGDLGNIWLSKFLSRLLPVVSGMRGTCSN